MFDSASGCTHAIEEGFTSEAPSSFRFFLHRLFTRIRTLSFTANLIDEQFSKRCSGKVCCFQSFLKKLTHIYSNMKMNLCKESTKTQDGTCHVLLTSFPKLGTEITNMHTYIHDILYDRLCCQMLAVVSLLSTSQ